MKHIILASTSTIHGGTFLEYLIKDLAHFFKHATTILFIPFARPSGISHTAYTKTVSTAFAKINKNVVGLHTCKNPKDAINTAEAIFVGGGNTFVLLNQLYKLNIINALKNAVNTGTPYLGTSAGSNICGLTIKNTNDMPILYPPSFNALALVPFNINPHYIDFSNPSTHMGETRETRIKEFHYYNTPPVVGLREGSWLTVNNTSITLQGPLNAKIFEHNKTPYQVATGTELNYLN